MSKVKLTMVCDEKQIGLIMDALEEYERLRIGQAGMLAEDLSDYWNASEDEATARIKLNNHIRNAIEECIEYALDMTGRKCGAKTDKVRSVEDLWMGLRYAIWTDLRTAEYRERMKYTVLGNEPLGYGEYPLADIKLEKFDEVEQI